MKTCIIALLILFCAQAEAQETSTPVADVPYAVVEEVPTYPGCENLTENKDKKTCMTQHITDFVNKNFDTSLGEKLGLKGLNNVYVQFRINKNGDAEFMESHGPAPELEKEAERVINLLPHMKPGKQRGKAVGVLYALPIAFQVKK